MRYIPFGLGIAAIILTEFVFIYGAWSFAPDIADNLAAPVAAHPDLANTQALGQVLYTDYVLPFQLAGLVLLVAMIGAIVLTHRTRPGVRRQKVGVQYARTREETVEIVKVTPGTGA